MTTAAARPDTTTGAPAGAPVDLAVPWGGRSRYADLGGPVHWVDFGGPTGAGDGGGAAAPPLVLVHGLGGSHLNWVGVAPALARHRRVVALDLVGFGLTPHEGRSSNVRDNAALVARFVREVVGEPAVLMGNSMGGMISLLVADRYPEVVEALVLVDASLPTPGVRPDRQVLLEFAVYATPFVGERYMQRNAARFTDRQRVLRTVAVCFADPSRADAAVVDAGVELAAWRRTLPGAERAFLGAARSLLRILRSGNRYPALITRVRQPTLLLHGELDKLVPVAAARATAESKPAWETEILAGVGHTPQLEVPDAVVARALPWLASLPG